jgi:hypothetical protein
VRALSLVLALVGACTPADGPSDDTDVDTDPADEAAWLDVLTADGDGRVGYTETSVTYDDEATGAPRTLRLVVWYPTADTTGTAAGFTGPRAPTDVLQDATPLPGPYPLALFSHGHQGDVDNVGALMAWFARHGWVAAAVEHTGNTLADGDQRTAPIYVQRPHDVSAALDQLLDRDAAWKARLDGRVFQFGHSFGGYTTCVVAGATWEVDAIQAHCETVTTNECDGLDDTILGMMRAGASDPRPSAFATLSGGDADLTDASTIDRPTLVMIGDTEGTSNIDAYWSELPAGNLRVDIVHGDHQTYTDFAQLGGGVIPGTSPDAVAWDRGWRIVRAYVGAHAWKHVLGKDGLDGILDGSVVVDADEAVVATK